MYHTWGDVDVPIASEAACLCECRHVLWVVLVLGRCMCHVLGLDSDNTTCTTGFEE